MNSDSTTFREAVFEAKRVRCSLDVRDTLHDVQAAEHGLRRFLEANLWVGNPGPVAPMRAQVPVTLDYEATGLCRVPMTWWDMLKESFIARNYTLATGLIAWGLLRDVRYDVRVYKSRRRERYTANIEVMVQVSQVLPAAILPPRLEGQRFYLPQTVAGPNPLEVTL